MKKNYLVKQDIFIPVETIKEISIDYLRSLRDNLIKKETQNDDFDGDASVSCSSGEWKIFISNFHPHGGSYNNRFARNASRELAAICDTIALILKND